MNNTSCTGENPDLAKFIRDGEDSAGQGLVSSEGGSGSNGSQTASKSRQFNGLSSPWEDNEIPPVNEFGLRKTFNLGLLSPFAEQFVPAE